MDLIDRQAAIEAVKNEMQSWLDGDIHDYRDVTDAIMDLLPAQPERKTGKWERHFVAPKVYANLDWYCSACGEKESYQWTNHYKYCPNCGAYMRMANDEE